MKVVYSNITPLSTSYSNVYHLYYLHEVLKAERIILCVWDAFVIEDERYHKLHPERRNRAGEIARNIQILERLLQSMHVDYRIIRFSEALTRFFRQRQAMAYYQKVLSKVTYKDLRARAEFRYGNFDDMTLSKMNYLIFDYLIAAMFTDLYPEMGNTNPSLYVANERFKVFYPAIKETFADQFDAESIPAAHMVKSIPLILNKDGHMPSLEMRSLQRRDICKSFVKEPMNERVCDDLLTALNMLLCDKAEISGKTYNYNEIREKLLDTDTNKAGTFLADLMEYYYTKLKEKVLTIKSPTRIPPLRIGESKRLQEVIAQLTPLKLKILRLCNGKRTSVEISKVLKANQITVAVYLGRLRKAGLISGGRRPKKLIKTVVFDIDNMEI